MAEGTGRSKQEAKHQAAANLLKIVEKDMEKPGEFSKLEMNNRTEIDYVGTLLDICVKRNLPVASFELIDSHGPSHAPSFTYECTVSHLKKKGTHSSKKGAKQVAAKAMFDLIQEMYPDDQKILVPVNVAMEAEETRTSSLFKSYREWKNSDSKFIPGVKLADRHNFFVNLQPEKYQKALAVLDVAETDKEKAHLLADALGFPLEVFRVFGEDCELTVLELECDFETVHVGTEEHVYRDFISYMKIMLNMNPLRT